MGDLVPQDIHSDTLGDGIVGYFSERDFQQYVEVHEWPSGSNVMDYESQDLEFISNPKY